MDLTFDKIGSLGFEPRYVGSKPTVLPLDELPKVDMEGVEPSILVCRTSVFPLALHALTSWLGFEPRLYRFGDGPTTVVFPTQMRRHGVEPCPLACHASVLSDLLTTLSLPYSLEVYTHDTDTRRAE